MALRKVVFVAAASALLVSLTAITALSWASGSPPLSQKALFQSVTPRNIEEVRNRLNGSPNDRNQLHVGTVLVYKTSAGNLGKLQIIRWGSRNHIPNYDLYVKFRTYRPDGSILTQTDSLRIKGTWLYDLDTGEEVSTLKNRTADLWWSWEDPTQAYLVFENGSAFTLVT